MTEADVLQLNKADQSIFKKHLVALQSSLKILPDKPEESPFSALCTLWHYVSGNPMSCQLSVKKPLNDLNEEQLERLQEFLNERIEGKPIAYIVGRQNFMGLELVSSPAALIPRKETELLAEVSLNYIAEQSAVQNSVKVLDQFTGSGNLPLCYANHFPHADVYGNDLSEAAIELALDNSQRLNLPVHFTSGDMFKPFESNDHYKSFNLISACPPYISEKNVPIMADEISNFEPLLAFDAGPFGVLFFMRLLEESPKFLKTGGWLAFEVGLGQGEMISRRLSKNNIFDKIETFTDCDGKIRVVAARKA